MRGDDWRTALERLGHGMRAGELESDTLDFKRPAEDVRKTLELLADAAVCFANAQGGTLVLGVDDKATARRAALVGAPQRLSIDQIRRGIFDRTRPNLTTSAREHHEDGVRLVIVHVPEGIELHANAKGLATRRLGTDCLPFTPEQQLEVRRSRGQVDWSAEPSAAAAGDVSEIEIDRVRRLLMLAGHEELATAGERALLTDLRLLSGRLLTNAGVLLVGSDEARTELAGRDTVAYQYRPAPGREASYRSAIAASIPAAIEWSLDVIGRRTDSRPLNLAGGVQLSLSDYPQRAVREVVVNALVHRDYSGAGPIDIEHSPDRLVLSSPGGLVFGVTPENILTHPSTPRHRLLTETVALLKLAERTGQGIDRAYREMLRAGKDAPAFFDDGSSVRAVLRGGIGNDAFVRFVSDLPESLGSDVDVLMALALLRSAPSIDAPLLAEAIQRSPQEAQDVLGRLADGPAALLEATRRTLTRPMPSYRLRNEPLAALARAVTYRRRTLDQLDEKVIDHVSEYGFVTNKTLQRMFDRDLYGSRNMLNDLRDRGLLAKLGTARGGPGVRYGPGPKFPATKRPSLPSGPVTDQLPLPDSET